MFHNATVDKVVKLYDINKVPIIEKLNEEKNADNNYPDILETKTVHNFNKITNETIHLYSNHPTTSTLINPHEQINYVNSISLNSTQNNMNINNPNLSCQKLARFVFPKSDPAIDPNWAVDDRTLPEKFLNIMCTSLGLLTSLELEHWNEICGRDCLFKEKSKAGIYATDYDIKQEQRMFKKKNVKVKLHKDTSDQKNLKSLRKIIFS